MKKSMIIIGLLFVFLFSYTINGEVTVDMDGVTESILGEGSEGNNAPVFIATPAIPASIPEGDSHVFRVQVYDPDGDQVTIKWYLGSELVSTTDEYEFTAVSTGAYTITVVISDGKLSNSIEFDVNVATPAEADAGGGGAAKPDVYNEETEDIPLGFPISSASSITHDQEIEDDDIESMWDGEITFQSANYDTRDILVFGQNNKFARVMTSLTSTEDDYHTDIVLEADVDSIKYYYVFDETIQPNLSTSSDPLEIRFLGKTLKIVNVDWTDGGKFTAHVGKEYFMYVGDSVEVEGKTVTLENVGEGGSVIVNVDGVEETIGSTAETVNGIEIKVLETYYETTKSQRSATLLMGKEAVETYKDGDAYIGEDKDDPNWVWNIGNLNSKAATTTSITEEYSGPYIGIENDFVWNDDSDNPAGVGDCIDLPNNYLKICLDELTVEDDNYKTYTFKKESNVDLSDIDPIAISVSALNIHTDQPEGLLIDTSELDIVGTETDPKSDNIWIWKCLDVAGGSAGKSGIYYEDLNGDIQMAGCVVNGVKSKNITDVTYGDTRNDNMRIYLEGTDSTFDLVVAPYDVTNLPYDDDRIVTSWTANDMSLESLGTKISLGEAGELVWIGRGATDLGETPIETLIGTKDEDHRTRYGVIIRNPKLHGAYDEVVLEIPSDQVQAEVAIRAGAQEIPPEPTDELEYDISLEEGWNLISIPLVLKYNSVNIVMADIAGNIDVIYGYNPLKTEKWEVWRSVKYDGDIPIAFPTANTLSTIEPGKAYWIKMDEPATLSVHGTIDVKNGDAPGTIPTFNVYEGWNLIGYYGTKDETALIALQNIDEKYSAIWTLFQDNIQSLQGTLKGLNFEKQLKRTHGYWIFLKEDGVIVPTS